jgi:hypothetical protein
LGSEPIPDLALASLRADFEDSDLPFRVDVIEERDLPETWTSGCADRLEPILVGSDEGR